MKILVSNYSTPRSTEPIYLNTAFNLAGCESTLWNNNISTFDIFDMVKPDLHITHFNMISMDLIIYLQESKNIELAINITGLNQARLKMLEEQLLSYNIKPKLFFVNHYDHNLKSKQSNVMSLLHGCDIFFGLANKQYTIENGIFIDDKKDIKAIGDTYHYLTNNDKLANIADIYLPEHQMSQLLVNYNNIIFTSFDGIIQQAFYDAAYYNGNVFFDLQDRSILDQVLNKLFGNGKYCDLSDKNTGNIKNYITKKHTCLHRAKSLLSQFPCSDNVNNLQKFIEIEGSLS